MQIIKTFLPFIKLLFFVAGIFILKACNEPDPVPEINYTFFVAGHTYGKPGQDNPGLYPVFEEKFELINQKTATLGFLTGDIVNVGTEKNWNEVDSVLEQLYANVYYVVGNHDMTDRPLFESRYGKTYFFFLYQGDLFIALDPNIDHWNISGDQLSFLKQTIVDNADHVKNIFVFFHQLLWWEHGNKYENIKPNSFEGRADSINFWTEIEPMFHSLSNDVYMFAGDVGAAAWSADLMYDHYDNITFVASGMGEGVGDNFVFIHVRNGNVSFELISLNTEDIHAMGNLEDYQLP